MDFGKWKQHDFAALNRIQRSNLRNFLRNNGVYVDKNTSIPKGMIQLLEESRPTIWPEAELLDAFEDGTILNSSLNLYVEGGLAFLKRKEREEKEERRATLSPKPEFTQPPTERSLQWSLQGCSKALSKHDLWSSQQGGTNHQPLCKIDRIHLSLRQHQGKNTGQYLDKSTSPTHRNHLFMKVTHPFMVTIHPPVSAMFHFTRM